MIKGLLLFMSSLSLCSLLAQPVSAGETLSNSTALSTFEDIQHDLAADKKRGDWSAFLTDAKRQKAFLNGSPTSSLEVARAYLQLRSADQASLEVARFVAMGQTNAILDSALFQSTRTAVDDQLRRNASSVSKAHEAFEVPDAGLLPEDIDYDPRSKRFFITSILQHRIVVLDWRHQLTQFAVSPHDWPMMAVKIRSRATPRLGYRSRP